MYNVFFFSSFLMGGNTTIVELVVAHTFYAKVIARHAFFFPKFFALISWAHFFTKVVH